MTSPQNNSPFRVIPGVQVFQVSGVRLVASDERRAPFPLDAIAVEEDTFLVLSADPVVRPPKDHFLKVFTELLEAEPLPLGSVHVSLGRPLKLSAIIHDLSVTPTWCEAWVQSALAGVLSEVENRGLQALGLPFLGSGFGQLSPGRFIELLRHALFEAHFASLRRIWLMVRRDQEWPDLSMLEQLR